MRDFATLQRQLGPALEANSPGSLIDHVMIALPSNRVSESAIARTPAEADEMYEGVRRVVQRLADRHATDREPSPAWPQAASEGAWPLAWPRATSAAPDRR